MNFEVFQGCCTIQIYRKVGGSNAHPYTIKWEVCDNTLVDECDFQALNQYRWIMCWSSTVKDYRVMRIEKLPNGRYVAVIMAREILGLPRKPGCNADKADHRNHDIKNHTRDNLRIVTPSQSRANTRRKRLRSRFQGVKLNGSGFQAHIGYHGQQIWFSMLRLENEAGWMYCEAAKILYGEFCHFDPFPEGEMPSPERQEELKQVVIEKLMELGLLV